ncbi:MAG: DUF3109 family protein [Prevotellaceae bacterium]|nr:DUF3109 family protein [Prevotellaceae bacterium]
MKEKDGMNIFLVGDVLVSRDCLEEYFCCDISDCHGACCIEGDAGAPVTEKEVSNIQSILPQIWDSLSVAARNEIERNGISYTDEEGDLVTSIVHGKDCVFTCYNEQGDCLCAVQKAQQEGRSNVSKPVSCSLYPIREKHFGSHLIGLNYHRWDVCRAARVLGKRKGIPVYRFLKEPLIARFGQEWYEELDELALTLKQDRD